MNEVRQAWTSLLSSRALLTTANLTGNHANGGSASVASTTTWYDAPAPVIIHSRTFREEVMEASAGKIAKDAVPSLGDSEKMTAKRRVSKDSGIETVATLRRTFLDEFRKSNDFGNAKTVKAAETKVGASDEARRGNSAAIADANSPKCSTRRDGSPANDPQRGAVNDEVLYQNNVEAALNSLSKICAKDLDMSGDSSGSRNPEGAEEGLVGPENDEEDKEREDTNDSLDVDGRRRRGRRTTSSASRRHSSTVELTAVTSVKTGDDGMPTISFSFLRSEENLKPYVRDIPIDDDRDEASAEQLVREQLYDFPKSGRAKSISETKTDDGVDARLFEDPARGRTDLPARLPERRRLGDGSVASDLVGAAEHQLYDFPKSRVANERSGEIKTSGNDDSSDKIAPRGSRCLTSEEEEEEEDENADRLYESPMHSKNALSSLTWKESTRRSTLENEREADQPLEADSGELPSPLGLSKRTFRSLRSGRSIGTLGSADVDNAAAVKGYYSDPEVENVEGIERAEGSGRKSRKQQRRLGKAWGKMRSWLREEKSRFGDVVTRHARMQAVGALKVGKAEEGSVLGGRTGSYDLTEATTRELGSVTRVEEFGLSSVSEEGNTSETERPECTSYDLRPDGRSPAEVGEHEDDDVDVDDDDDDDNDEGKKRGLDSSNDSPDAAPGRLWKKNALSTDHMLSVNSRMKLSPVSFSLDKLCVNEGNDEGANTPVAGHRDGEQARDHVGKGGLIKRRMLGSIRGLMASTHLLQQHETEEGGPGGFEDVRRYVKQGGDFCKELAAILHERAELEASYCKGLSKLSCKLTKACTKDQGGNCSAGVTEAWRSIGEEMEAAAEAHRAWGVALSEQLAKPLRVGVAEAQGRSRKVIESSVDKASKSLQEWRGIAAKSKKQSFACARENERLQDLARIQSITQCQQNNNKTSSHHMTEKEVNKLENRRRKAEDSSRRADTEFYTVSVRAERARLEYESTVRKGAKQMELLEEERLSALKDLANVYLAHLQALAPRLQQSADRLSSPVRNCSVAQDVDILKNVIRRLDSSDASNVDQLLPDFYAEHVTLAMNRERRKQSLVRVLHLIRQDLERERRGREGLETLHRAFIQTPAFAADESTQNVTEKLHHMRSMLTFLEAARYKVGGTLAEVEGGKRGKHPLAEHILVSRDKQGLQQSVLKVPSWAKNESFEFPEVQDELDIHLTKEHEAERRDWVDRTAGDGNSENPPDEEDFSDFDEFSSQSEDNNNQEVEIADITDKSDRIEQCRAIYQYSANLNDELSLTPGDLITIHEKQADGWWIGECGGRTGIFPATYVQVIH